MQGSGSHNLSWASWGDARDPRTTTAGSWLGPFPILSSVGTWSHGCVPGAGLGCREVPSSMSGQRGCGWPSCPFPWGPGQGFSSSPSDVSVGFGHPHVPFLPVQSPAPDGTRLAGPGFGSSSAWGLQYDLGAVSEPFHPRAGGQRADPVMGDPLPWTPHFAWCSVNSWNRGKHAVTLINHDRMCVLLANKTQ